MTDNKQPERVMVPREALSRLLNGKSAKADPSWAFAPVPELEALRACLDAAAPRDTSAGEDGLWAEAILAAELVEWWDTGILRDGAVRAEAAAMLAAGKADSGNEVRQAEREIIGRIVRAVAALGNAL